MHLHKKIIGTCEPPSILWEIHNKEKVIDGPAYIFNESEGHSLSNIRYQANWQDFLVS